MASALVWISGASGGIGGAFARTVPWPGARVINIGRHPAPGAERLEADLADPSQWPGVGAAFAREAGGLTGGEPVVFVQAAGTLEPIGFAGEVDAAAYARNVVLNAAAPQVLGHYFLAAMRHHAGPRHLLMLTSGAARSVYPGWSSYGAAKAAVDQWVRDVGAEQQIRGGVTVLSVGPGTVDTAMQSQLRATNEADFPSRPKFVALHDEGKLAHPSEVARKIWRLLDSGLDNGSVVDLRNL